MKKTFIILATALLTSMTMTAQTNPAKAGIRWWWLGSAVNKEGLTAQMSEFASHGVGTLEITPLYGVKGNDKNNIQFLSPKWMDMLKYAISEGNRLGIQIDMNLGTGWPFGGPTTPITEAACKVIVVDSLCTKKVAKTLQLQCPPKEQDATLILQKEFPVYKSDVKEGAPILDKKLVRVIALYQGRTHQKVKRAAPGGEGYVIDHFDSTAVAHYLSKFDKAFTESGMYNEGSRGSNSSRGSMLPATYFNDSYEVYGADWTPTLLQEFKKRRGYALEDKLPEFVDGDPQVISDYRETLGELLLKNFTEQWVAWSHKHGVKVRNQAHGSPANLIDIYGAVDIPEIEGFGLSEFGIKGLRQDKGFTKKNFSDLSMLKYAPSAAHITGKPYASSETFTWLTEHFRTSLSQMKPDLDLMFCSGVNRMFFHGAAYSPKDDPWPGWRFYASVDMSPTNSIWRDAGMLMNYIQYCQTKLQAGRPDADFMVVLPVRNMWRNNTVGAKNRCMTFDIHAMDKKAPEFIKAIINIDKLGYDCDYISENYLMGTTFKDGMLETAAGTRYAALVMPQQNIILSEATKEHIEKLKEQGAKVIYSINSNTLGSVAKPEEIRSKLHMKMIRRQVDGDSSGSPYSGYQYFVSNLTSKDIDETVSLAATGKKAHIVLKSGESCFLYTTKANDEVECIYPVNELQPKVALPEVKKLRSDEGKTNVATTDTLSLKNNAWTLSFIESQPKVDGTFKLPALQTWENGVPGATAEQNDSIKTLMGTGVYETTFVVGSKGSKGSKGLNGTASIDLGDLRESARVYINGVNVGTAWCLPFTLNFPANLIKKGVNTVRIEVTNLPANRIAYYDRKGVKWRKFNEINVVDLNYKKDKYDSWAPVPSGLNSDVTIKF